MASGSKTGSVTNKSNYFTFYLEWTSTPNEDGNYSDVTVKTYVSTNNTAQTFDTTGTRNHYITIDGTEYKKSARIICNPWNGNKILIQEASKRVYHNDDGTKSIYISASSDGTATNSSGAWGYSANGNPATIASHQITLDAIARYPDTPEVTAPTTSTISETSKSISISWGKSNRGTYTVEVSKNGGAWSAAKTGIALETLSYSYTITPSQGDTYKFRVKAIYNNLSSGYSESGTIAINKLNPPTIGTLGVFNPYVNKTYNVPLSEGSQTNGGGFKRCANIHVDGTYKYPGTAPSSNNNDSVNITVDANSIAEDLGNRAYSSSTKFTIVAWTENSNGSRSSYVSKTFTVNINSDGGATPTITAPTISGGAFNHPSTCFIAGVSDLVVTIGTMATRRAPSGTSYGYKIEVTGYDASTTSPKRCSNLSAGIKTIKTTITDSRGLSAEQTIQVRVQPYALPTIRNLSGSRLTNPNTSATITYELAYSPIYAYNSGVNTQGGQLNGINSQEYSIGNSAWRSCTTGATITGLAVGSTHQINLRVADKVKTTSYGTDNVLIPTIIVPFAFRRSGIGINCIPQSGYVLDIGGATRVNYSNGSIVLKNGCVELLGETPYIDFHYGNSSDDFNVRLINQASGQLTVVGNLNVQGRIHQQYVSIPANSDMNSYIASGIYICTEGSSYKNSPESAYMNGILEVIHLTEGLMKQVYTRYDGVSWQRICWFSNWYAWKQITN